jgi:hypothetical protein
MDVNDNSGYLNNRGVVAFFASEVAPAGYWRSLVVSVQRFVQFDGRFVGLAFHGTGFRIAAEQKV